MNIVRRDSDLRARKANKSFWNKKDVHSQDDARGDQPTKRYLSSVSYDKEVLEQCFIAQFDLSEESVG